MRLLPDLLFSGVILLCLALISGLLFSENAKEVRGYARVQDGDTLVIDDQVIRLDGIDAPELEQTCGEPEPFPCGRQAKRALQKLAQGLLRCTGTAHDRYKRLIATCRNPDQDMGAAMVEQGWAISKGRYHIQEKQARASGRGIWSGAFMNPEEWRRRNML